MKIYGNPISSNAKRVNVCLAELGLSPEMVTLDFAKGEHKSPEYLAVNPMGKVPTLDDDGFKLWESAAIAWYLCELNPSKGLLPADLKGRADAMRWMFWNSCHLESALSHILVERVIKPMMKQDTDEHVCTYMTAQLDRYLPVLNASLEGREWLGETFTVADISLGVTLELCTTVNVDLSSYKHIGLWLGRLQSRDSWKKATVSSPSM
jgi:glutathione S-transferase